MIYAGVDDCGIYINDSADQPRFTRTHLTEAQAFDLAIDLLRQCVPPLVQLDQCPDLQA